MRACALLDLAQLFVVLGLRFCLLLAECFDDVLTICLLLGRLTLLDEAYAVQAFTHLLDLGSHNLLLTLVRSI